MLLTISYSTIFGGIVLICLIPILFHIILAAPIVLESIFRAEPYATMDIADYGNYIGNYDKEKAPTFINSFLKKEIEEIFSEVEYSYRAQDQGLQCT